MSDDLELPATGSLVATREESGRHFQEVDVVGELLEAIEAMRAAIVALTRSIGMQMPDAAGRQRVALETAVGLTIPTITVVGTVTTVTGVTTVATVSNQTNMGGFAANLLIPSVMASAADSNRRGIIVT